MEHNTTPRWRVYYPDEGQTAETAIPAPASPRYTFPELVAAWAVEHDWTARQGEDRGFDAEFTIAVIDPEGVETRWVGWHEASVDHLVVPHE